MQKLSPLSTNHLLIACFVFSSDILTAQSVEIKLNANNEPRVEPVNPNANTFIGDETGILNTGHQNTFSGYKAGFSNTTGSNNSFFGYNSGYTNSAGHYNSFFGWRSGFSNTTGQNNTFFGLTAGYTNSAGSSNAFFGRGAGYFNTASENSFLGFNSGYSNSTGTGNSFFGTASGFANSVGAENSFFGFAAGTDNTTGFQNSFFGRDAGVNNTIGNSNSFFGLSSGFFNSTGADNSFFGFAAGFGNTTGSQNSFFGRDAGANNTIGNFNSFLGKRAGYNNTTGNKNTIVGILANVTTANLTNATAIGYNAKVGSSNSLILGGTGADAVNVGIGTTTPNASAALDITSTTKGFLPPRMPRSAREAIVNLNAGLMIWCSDCGSSGQIQVYNGFWWTNLLGGVPAGLTIGDLYAGGKVAYILQPGDPGYIAGEIHGLIATLSDQSAGIQWYNGIYTNTGAIGTDLGTGQTNTTAIVTNQGAGSYAAQICNDLVLNGYSDWFLPSKDELNKLYLNQTAIGGFASSTYWSSSEVDIVTAWSQFFFSGSQYDYGTKNSSHYVRAVRAF